MIFKERRLNCSELNKNIKTVYLITMIVDLTGNSRHIQQMQVVLPAILAVKHPLLWS